MPLPIVRRPPGTNAFVLLLALVVSAACGGDGDGSTASPVEPPANGAVDRITDVKDAVVRIEARGTFTWPGESFAAYEEFEEAGSGSGFVVHPDGIVVTNNHVVTGAGALEVFVGDAEEPVGATVLGVSECADLAVLDLEGDGYPYLAWYDGEIEPGLEVRAAGFPLGDPEYTLTGGIVSKAKANGETPWASVDSVIEHDVNIQPGNSGGPLVDAATARVVGVNYAGGDPGTGTSQFFAISAKLAEPMVEDLQDGDVLSLGINGQVVVDDIEGVSGIWVASVDTDSPAADVGIRGGDIVEKLEGLSVGGDGTMGDYCDVLGSHRRGERLSVQVLRYAAEARLRGAFNGDELEPFESLAGDVEEATGEIDDGAGGYDDYVTLTDDSETVSVEVPGAWSQVDGSAIEHEGVVLPGLTAAPDLDAFRSGWTSPGLELRVADASAGDDPDELLDLITDGAEDECVDEGREAYDDGLYTGRIAYFGSCGGTGAITVGIAASPEGGEFTVLVLVQLETTDDYGALDRIVQSFRVA